MGIGEGKVKVERPKGCKPAIFVARGKPNKERRRPGITIPTTNRRKHCPQIKEITRHPTEWTDASIVDVIECLLSQLTPRPPLFRKKERGATK